MIHYQRPVRPQLLEYLTIKVEHSKKYWVRVSSSGRIKAGLSKTNDDGQILFVNYSSAQFFPVDMKEGESLRISLLSFSHTDLLVYIDVR